MTFVRNMRFKRYAGLLLAGLALGLASCTAFASELACGGFRDVGNDTAGRFFHRASVLTDGRVMVSGGMALQVIPPSLNSLNALSFYNPATETFGTSFTPANGGTPVTPHLILARSTHTQTTLPDGRVLIAGGLTGAAGTSPGAPTNACELFSPATGVVSQSPAMSAPRADHTTTLLSDGRVLVAGGSTWQLFDSATTQWSASRSLARSRAAHAAVLLPNHDGTGEDRVLLIAGNGSGPTTLELLDPDDPQPVLMTSTLAVGVDDLAAARLSDGRVLIVGGQNQSNGDTIPDTYVFDPVADALIAAPPPPNRTLGISDHQILTFANFVAVLGGEQQTAGQDTELTYAAVYNASSGEWACNFTMNHPHDDYTAVALAPGRFLLIGGGIPFLGNELPSNFAEVFDPIITRLGDVNDDASVSPADIPAFVAAVLDPSAANERTRCAADCNRDGRVNAYDLPAFARLLLTGN